MVRSANVDPHFQCRSTQFYPDPYNSQAERSCTDIKMNQAIHLIMIIHKTLHTMRDKQKSDNKGKTFVSLSMLYYIKYNAIQINWICWYIIISLLFLFIILSLHKSNNTLQDTLFVANYENMMFANKMSTFVLLLTNYEMMHRMWNTTIALNQIWNQHYSFVLICNHMCKLIVFFFCHNDRILNLWICSGSTFQLWIYVDFNLLVETREQNDEEPTLHWTTTSSVKK